jgi:hypothetical protein
MLATVDAWATDGGGGGGAPLPPGAGRRFVVTRSFAALQLATRSSLATVGVPLALGVAALAVAAGLGLPQFGVAAVASGGKNGSQPARVWNESSVTDGAGPFWAPPSAAALLALLALTWPTVLLPLLRPLLVAESGHFSDHPLPSALRVCPIAAPARPAPATGEAPPTTSAADAHPTAGAPDAAVSNATGIDAEPFARVPLTPKAVGLLVAVLFHPVSTLLLLFTTAVTPHLPQLSASASPLGVFSGWLTFDFARRLDSGSASCAAGRAWYWLAGVGGVVGLCTAVVGVAWIGAHAQIQQLGGRFPRTVTWAALWAIALAGFPLFLRQLLVGVGCAWVKSSRVPSAPNSTAVTTAPNASTSSPTPLGVVFEPRAVSLLCRDTNCGDDAYPSLTLLVLLLCFPFVLVMHTQLRRLSVVPRQHANSVAPVLPRTAGAPLLLFTFTRFLVPLLSAAGGGVAGLAVASLLLDTVTGVVVARTPLLSNVRVLNFWWRNAAVPGSWFASLGFAAWTLIVHANDASSLRAYPAYAALLERTSTALQLVTLALVVGTFAATAVTHYAAYVADAPRSVNAGNTLGGNSGSAIVASFIHLPLAGQPLSATRTRSHVDGASAATTPGNAGANGRGVPPAVSPPRRGDLSPDSLSPEPSPSACVGPAIEGATLSPSAVVRVDSRGRVRGGGTRRGTSHSESDDDDAFTGAHLRREIVLFDEPTPRFEAAELGLDAGELQSIVASVSFA